MKTLTGELRSVEGSTDVSPVGASVANDEIEESMWEMQSTTRTTVANVEWVYSTTSDLGSAISVWIVEIVCCVVSMSGQVFQRRGHRESAESEGTAAKSKFRGMSW